MATYCLIINLNQKTKINVGKLGEFNFKKGYYVYVGSALNSLEGRIKRHLRKEKKLHWHIDYLLASTAAHIEEVIFENSKQKWECSIAEEISLNGCEVDGFGCSDCKCTSHLFYFKDYHDAESACLNSFKNFKLTAITEINKN